MPVPRQFLFLSRHFGTGVLIATAFVHLLPTAFNSLTDPCLPSFWNHGYPAMAGFIAMISVMVVVGVEMFFATKGAGHSHSSEYVTPGEQHEDMTPLRSGNRERPSKPLRQRSDSYRPFSQGKIGAEEDSNEHLALQDASPWQEDGSYNDTEPLAQKRRASLDDTGSNSDLDLDELDPHVNGNGHGDIVEPSLERTGSPSDQQQQQKMLLQCLLLEAGILFHSVFIGMAVSVATGTSFIVLLVAISFHQTFEGLALGSRIAAITIFPKRSPRPWLMALAYGTTTPLGQAIGLLVHNLYDPFSQTGLLMVGIMNAISSGLLLFAGLVELLAEDFLSDESYEVLRGRKRLQACGAVVAGSLLMALVGAWA
jgi:zinc transporter 1/2/3